VKRSVRIQRYHFQLIYDGVFVSSETEWLCNSSGEKPAEPNSSLVVKNIYQYNHGLIMNRFHFPVELIFQIFTLLIAFIIIHAAYVSIIRPQAAEFLASEQQLLKENPNHVQSQNFYVVIKDYEQEACFVLMIWALAILCFKGNLALRQKQQLGGDLLELPATLPIGLEDTRTLLERLGTIASPARKYLLTRALKTGVQRFGVTGNIQDSATAVRNVCESEMERQESELSIIRYIAWAIPSVGFIGTVRGIGAQSCCGRGYYRSNSESRRCFQLHFYCSDYLHRSDVLYSPATALPGAPGS